MSEAENSAPPSPGKAAPAAAELKVEMWPIGRVKPYPGNPRVNALAVAPVISSIREFGWRQPIVVDEDGVVIAGHTRLAAATEMGLDEVPVHVAAGLSPEKARAYRLADNKTGELSGWDFAKLKEELAGLLDSGFDVRMPCLAGIEIPDVGKVEIPTEPPQRKPGMPYKCEDCGCEWCDK